MAVLNIAVTYPTAQGQTLLDLFAAQHSYQAFLADESGALVVPNPETKQNFLIRKVKEFLSNSIKAAKAKTDAEAARVAAIALIESTIPIT